MEDTTQKQDEPSLDPIDIAIKTLSEYKTQLEIERAKNAALEDANVKKDGKIAKVVEYHNKTVEQMKQEHAANLKKIKDAIKTTILSDEN